MTLEEARKIVEKHGAQRRELEEAQVLVRNAEAKEKKRWISTGQRATP